TIEARAAELGRRIVARGLHDLPLDDLPAEHEWHEPLAALVKRLRGAIEPPVQLDRRARTRGEVRERCGQRREGRFGVFALDGTDEPVASRGVEGKLAELALQRAFDEARDLVLRQHASEP